MENFIYLCLIWVLLQKIIEYALEYNPWGGNKKDIKEWKNFQ